MANELYGKVNLYSKALDAAWKRNEVIAGNIANVDTPGYKRNEVAFEKYMQQAMEAGSFRGYRTNEKHIAIGADRAEDVKVEVRQDNKNLSMRLDGNNVDIENEMALLAKNDIYYNTMLRKLSGELSKLRSAINEGRR